MKAIGPTFGDEVKAAGLSGLPFSWGSDGVIQFSPLMSQAQKDAVLAVYAAHDPAKALGPDLRAAAKAAVLADPTVPASVKALLALLVP